MLLEHASIADAAVVGVPHPRWGETPLAFVVPATGRAVDEADVIAHCRDRLASFKKPSGVVVLDELPRNAAGKVLKRRLRESLRLGAAS